MYKVRRYTKRAVSAVLSLIIVVSAMSCLLSGLTASALSAGDVTLLNTTEGLSQANSMVAGEPMVYFQKDPAEGPQIISMAYPGNLSDSGFTTESEIYGGSAPYYDLNSGYNGSSTELAAIRKLYIDGSERFAQITLPLKGLTDISNILVVNHVSETLRNYYYEIFASDKAVDLYNPANSVYLFTNVSNSQTQNFKIAEGKLTGKKYVGMRLYNPTQTVDGRWSDEAIARGVGILYPRFYEFNVYGTPSADQSGDILTESSGLTVPTENSVVVATEVTFNDGTTEKEISDKDASVLIDGNLATEFMGSGTWAEGDAGNLTYFTDRSYNIIHTLDGLCDISKIFVYHHATQGLMTYKYKVYASLNRDDLFNSENLVYDYTNSEFIRGQMYTPNVKAKYVALSITQPSFSKDYAPISIYPRLMEFDVYGLKEGETDPNAVDLQEGSSIALPEGTSVVKATAVKAYDGTSEITRTDYWGDTTNLLDGDLSTEYYGPNSFAGGSDNNIEYPAGRYVKIEYELDGLCDVSSIYVANHATPYLMTQEYKLYAATTETKLYDSESLVYEYSNKNSKQFQLYKLSRKAKYVAMVITKPSSITETVMSSIYPRLYEFNVYGTPEEKFENPDGVLTEYDSKVLPTESGIVKSTVVSFVKGGNETVRESSTLPLTNGSANDEYYGGGTWASGTEGNISYFDNVELRIKHQLYGLSDVTDVWVYNHQNPIMMTYKYKIYASEDESTLYDKESLVYEYENTNLKQVQVFSLNRKAKYVAMVITQPSTTTEHPVSSIYPRLCEFNVFGTPGVLPTVGVTDYEDTTFPTGNNFLNGMVPSITAYNTEKNVKKSVSGDTVPMLNNGTADDGGFYTGFMGRDYFADWDEERDTPILRTDGSVYVDFEYKLGGTATLEKMYIGNHISKNRRILTYALYASTSDSGDLFAESNRIGVYENDNGVRGQEIAFSAPVHGVRRVGVRILDPFYDKVSNRDWITQENVTSGSCSVYTRLNEIAAFGSFEQDPYVFQKVLRNGVAALPKGVALDGLTNLGLPFTPRMNFTANGETQKSSITNISHLADGDLKTESECYTRFAEWVNGAPVYYTNGTHYFDLYYDLKSEADLKYIVVASNANVDLAIGRYGIFVSDSKDDIFDSDNLYVEVDNVEALKNGEGIITNVICFDEALSGESSKCRYVGIRIYNPVANQGAGSAEVTETNNQIYTRIREFAVYGNYIDPSFVPEIISYTDTNGNENLHRLDEIYGKNLLKQANVSYMKNGKKHEIGTDKKSENEFWADNTGAVHYDFSTLTASEMGSPIWIFKLDDYELTNIKGFAYQGVIAGEPYYVSHMRVYVAKEREDLFLSSSCVFEYIAEDHGVNKGIIYEFPAGRIPQGTYMAFEFVNPVTSATTWDYQRISLLHAWGDEAIIEVNPANIAENMPIDAYFNNDGKFTEISDSNLTTKEVKALTDGNKSTFAKINTKGSARDRVELVYNLCGDINIDKITLSALINSTTGFKTLKVYAADTLAEVNTDDALIWSYNVGSKKGDITPSKSFSKPQKMRYIRFVFQGTKDYIQLGEIEVIGLDNQKMKTRNITSSLTAEHINISMADGSGNSNYVSASDSFIEQLIDGDGTSFIQLIRGTVGEDKYNILFYLDDLRTISEITVSFVSGFREYRPKTINVYVGETEADATDPDATPTYTIDVDKVSGNQHIKELRPMLGRFVRFELAEFYFNEYYVDKDGKGVISAILADIKITGTKVVGLQTDEHNNTLMEFTDKETGIKLALNRLDINDIFTDATSLRVTPEKATNWQKRSLEAGSLEVVGGKVYTVELIDLYGNVVTDIGGREIEISFPTPKGAEPGTTVLGNASERTKIEAMDTYENGDRSAALTDEWKTDAVNKFALLRMVSSDDPYWDSIGELENFEEGSEEDLQGNDFEVHDASWYESIHTEDGLFTVTPINFQFPDGAEFVAADIAQTVTDAEYEKVLTTVSNGKKIAAYYDMSLLYGGADYKLNLDPSQSVEVYWQLPASVLNGYTDLEIWHVDDNGEISGLWSGLEPDGKTFVFQTSSFSGFVVMGNVAEGGTNFGSGGDYFGGSSPETGESTSVYAVSLMFIIAAGYVLNCTAKRAK